MAMIEVLFEREDGIEGAGRRTSFGWKDPRLENWLRRHSGD